MGGGRRDGKQRRAGATGGITYTYYSGSTATGTPLSSSPITAGTYTVVASYGGNSNYAAATSSPVTFTILPPSSPVSVTGFQINDGNVQRSMIESLTVTFRTPVTLAAGCVATGPSGTVPIQLKTTNNTTYVVSWSGSQFIGGSLANGNYVLTINHALVSSSSGAMSANQTYSFYRLYGDFYGTGTVGSRIIRSSRRCARWLIQITVQHADRRQTVGGGGPLARRKRNS